MPWSGAEFVAVFLVGGIAWGNMAIVRPWSQAVAFEKYVRIQRRPAGQ